jgi:hypothetical protein
MLLINTFFNSAEVKPHHHLNTLPVTFADNIAQHTSLHVRIDILKGKPRWIKSHNTTRINDQCIGIVLNQVSHERIGIQTGFIVGQVHLYHAQVVSFPPRRRITALRDAICTKNRNAKQDE